MIDPACCASPSGGGFLAIGVLLAVTAPVAVLGIQDWLAQGHAPTNRFVRADIALTAMLAAVTVVWSIIEYVSTP